jgi:hypothetical protein
VPFPYDNQEDIKCCWQKKVGTAMRYWERHWLAYGEDYTVSALDLQDLGGKLYLLITLPTDAQELVIRRVTPKTQEIELHDGGRLRATLIEEIGDKTTMEVQELAEQALTKDDLQDIKSDLNEAIETEKSEREAADETLQDNINAEAETRMQADATLQSNINSEASARQSADENLQQNINTETQNRQNQDDLLQTHINEEAAARTQADQGLHNEIIAEQTARQQQDNNLDIKKLDKLPDQINPLIDSTGKISEKYIPDTLLGAVKYGGTFDGNGIINSSDLAPSLQGVKIDNVVTANYSGFYFLSQSTYTFNDVTYDAGDKAISQGNHIPNWAKIDNTDAVSSVNDKLGAVVLTAEDIGLGNVLDAPQIIEAEKAQPNGVASLDETGKVPFSQIPDIAINGFGVFKLYIPQEGPKAQHLVLRHPVGTEPPNMYINRDTDSPLCGHLIWNTEGAGDIDLGNVAYPLVSLQEEISEINEKIGNLESLDTDEKDNLVDAINEVNSTAGSVQTVDGIEADSDKNVQLLHVLTQAEYNSLKEANGGKAPAGRYNITDRDIDSITEDSDA